MANFNLFDFASKLNPLGQLGNQNKTSLGPVKSSNLPIVNKPINRPIPKPALSTGFSLIPKASASSEPTDQELEQLIAEGYTDEEIMSLYEDKAQPTTQEDNRPLWKKLGEGVVNFAAGNLEKTLTYGGNLLDLATGGALGIGEDVKSMQEQNKQLFADSSAFNVGKAMPDVALAVAPLGKAVQGMGLIKGGIAVGGGYGALQPILDKGSAVTGGDIVKGGLTGAIAGGLTGGVLKGGGKLLNASTKALPAKLQLSGIINPAKLDAIKKAIISEGEKTPEDVAKWMLDRGIKGDKAQIIKLLEERASKSMTTVNQELAKIKTKVKSEEVKTALQQLYKDLSGVSGMEAKAGEIGKLLKKKTFTLTELNQVKRELDNVYNIYKTSGEVSAGLKAQGLNNVRQNIKKLIENEASKAGFADVRMLNNETQVSKGLAEGIANKDNADYVRELLSPFASRVTGGLIGSQAGPFDNNTIEGKIGNVILGAVVGGATQSTKFKTNVASILNKFTKQELSVLDKYITTGGSAKVNPGLLDKFGSYLKSFKEGTKKLPLTKVETPKQSLLKQVWENNKKSGNQGSIGMGTRKLSTGNKSNPLIEEAKKYKSADEFVKSRKLYHGTSQEKYNNIQKEGWKTPNQLMNDGRFEILMYEDHVSTTKDFKVAERYALRDRKGGKIVVLDNSDLKLLEDKTNIQRPYEEWKDYLNRLQEEGYDGIDGQLGHPNFVDYMGEPGKGDTEVLVWNIKKIKEMTKEREQKLKDIYNQSQILKDSPKLSGK